MYSKISELASATLPLNAADELVIVQGGTTMKVAAGDVVDPAALAQDSEFVSRYVSKAGGSVVQPAVAATIGLIIRGAAAQTANLQEWQDSAGTVVASISVIGRITNADTVNTIGVRSLGAGTALYIQSSNGSRAAEFGPTYSEISAPIRPEQGVGSKVPLRIIGAAAQTANLQEWQDSVGTVLARIRNDGVVSTWAVQAVGGGPFIGLSATTINNTLVSGQEWLVNNSLVRILDTGQLLVSPSAAQGSVPSVWVKAYAGQTADLVQFQDSASAVLAKFTAAGKLVIGANAAVSSDPVVRVLGFSDTVPLQEWGDGGSIYLKVGRTSGNAMYLDGAGFSAAEFRGLWDFTGGVVGTKFEVGGTTAFYVDGGVVGGRLTVATSGQMSINSGLSAPTNTVLAVVQGSAGHTADLLQMKDSAGTVIFSVAASGALVKLAKATGKTYQPGLVHDVANKIFDLDYNGQLGTVDTADVGYLLRLGQGVISFYLHPVGSSVLDNRLTIAPRGGGMQIRTYTSMINVLSDGASNLLFQGFSDDAAFQQFRIQNFTAVFGKIALGVSEGPGTLTVYGNADATPTLIARATSPTQTADLAQFQDSAAAVLAKVTAAGGLMGESVQLSTVTAKPAASVTHRGKLWLTQGGAGVADTLEVCRKDAADAYGWVTLI